MKIAIVAVGRIREPSLRAAVDDYLTRIQHYLPVEEIEVQAGSKEETNGRGSQTLVAEGERLQRALARESFVVCLDRSGEEVSSEEFSVWLQARMRESVPRLAFVLGGAWGLSPVVLARSQFTLSLSQLTFPHELSRLILVEQLYRALTLWKGEKYHK